MDFDTAKENIQPLRGGRNIQTLETALYAENDVETQNQLAKIRRQYEEAIQSNSQDEDPLEPWCDYILWLEQIYPKSGKESTLDEVLVKCIKQFEFDPRFKQDRRMVKIYIKFIDTQKEPQGYYQDLYNQGIGTMVSDLYIAWAYYFDIMDNFKQAEAVFRKGLDAVAQPYDELVQAHKNFSFSVSQRIIYNDEESKKQWRSTMSEKRLVLTSLRAHKKKHVGSMRTGGVVKSYTPGIVNQENQSNNAAAQSLHQSVKVYDDVRDNEATQPDTSMQTNKPILRSIVDSARVRENVHEPGPWSNISKNEKKKGHLFDHTSRHALGFSIMEDTDDKPKFGPIPILVDNFKRGIQITSNFVRKNNPQTVWQVAPIYIEPDEKQTNSGFVKIPCYDKFMLYPKPDLEFSPEELRGYRWFKKQNIKNVFTNLSDSIWTENFECGARLPLDFVSKNWPQKTDMKMPEFKIEEGQKFSFRIEDVYPTDGLEEYSFEELMMKKKWQKGLIKKYHSQENIEMDDVDEMDETTIGPRRMSIHPLRLSHLNRRTTVLPVKEEYSPVIRNTKNPAPLIEEEEKEDLGQESQAQLHFFEDAPLDNNKYTGAIRKSFFNKRGSSYVAVQQEEDQLLKRKYIATTPIKQPAQDQNRTFDVLEQSDGKKMPPPVVIPMTKNQPIVDSPEPKAPFEIYQDEINLPNQMSSPNLRPTNPNQMLFNSNETCSTQTFNFFIQTQSVSTPNIKKPQKIFTSELTEEHQMQFKSTAISFSPPITSPPDHTNDYQDYQTPPLTTNTAKQLSTIMETTETNTLSSATSTKSSVDVQGSSPESDVQDYSLQKIHQKTQINEKTRADLYTLTEQEEVINEKPPISFKVYEDNVSVKPILYKNNISSMQQDSSSAPKSFKIFEDRTETVPGMLSYKIGEDRTEAIPVMPSFKGLEDRTETMPVMPSFKIFEDRTETMPAMPSFKMTEDRTETMPLIPSFKVPGDRTATIPSFKHLDNPTDPHISIFSKQKPTEVSTSEFGSPELENSSFLNSKPPTLPSFQIFEDRADTQPMIPILQKNNSHATIEDALESRPSTSIPNANKGSIFDINPAKVEKSAHFESQGVGIFQPSIPETTDFFELFSRTPEKAKKITTNKSLFDFFMPKSPEPPQTPKKLTNHKKDYILYKPGMIATNKSLLSAAPMQNDVSGRLVGFPKSSISALDKSLKELSLSFSDFHAEEKKYVDDKVPASLFAERESEKEINDFFKIPAATTPSSMDIASCAVFAQSAMPAKSKVSGMFSASRTTSSLLHPQLSKSIIESARLTNSNKSIGKSFLSATPMQNDVSGTLAEFSKSSGSELSARNIIKVPNESCHSNQNTSQKSLPSNTVKITSFAVTPPPKADEILFKTITPTFASGLEDDYINTEKFSLNLSSIQNSTLLPEKLIMTKGFPEKSVSAISGTPINPNEISMMEKTAINVEKTLLPTTNVEYDLSVSLGEHEMLALMNESTKPERTIKNKTVAPEQLIIHIDETCKEDDYVPDAHEEALGVSIYVPRVPSNKKIMQYNKQAVWEEIDETFQPDVGNEYNHVAVDLDQTNRTIGEFTHGDINPFSKQLCDSLLGRIDFFTYIENLDSCVMLNRIAPLKKGAVVDCRLRKFQVMQIIGNGGYGTVFSGKCTKTNETFAMKQERPANLWEYYICLELQSRLSLINTNILHAFMSIDYAIIANNASLLISNFSPHGNILDVCNKVRNATRKNVDEHIVMMLTSQILLIIDHLHACNIIHADVKPDNFLLMKNIQYGSKDLAIQLIDFGVSIDMQLFKPGTTFKQVSKTDGFTCTEMLENKPWTFQTDLFGVAGSTHVMLFGKYMEVEQQLSGWNVKTRLPRYFNRSIWENFFRTLLNIPDCREMPNLQALRYSLDEKIAEKEKCVRDKIVEFNNCLFMIFPH